MKHSSIIVLLLLIPTNAFRTIINGRQGLKTRPLFGILDSFSNFLNSRNGDFIKLEETESAFGPGPAIILYKVPPTIASEEVLDMVSDGAPRAFKKGVKLVRIHNTDNPLMDLTLEEALRMAVNDELEIKDENTMNFVVDNSCPVLFFSGFENNELMATYNIIGSEIYQESGASAACAKAVANALPKQVGQVLEEISGDHLNALSMDGPLNSPEL